MWQQLAVALIVIVAALYAAWKLMPAAWRRMVTHGMLRGSVQAGMLNATRASQWQHQLDNQGGCGSCSSCKGCASPGQEQP